MDSSTKTDRQRWLGVLARSDSDALADCLGAFAELPPYEILRPAEPGAVMVQGRAGGDGAAFHLGEMTVTRCAVQLENGALGVGYVQGRSLSHAEQAAGVDAMAQDPRRSSAVHEHIIAPLAAGQAAARRARSAKAASTKADFFTLVRGDN